MKKTMLSAMMFLCPILAGAQTTDIVSATLQAGDNTQVFYGQNALGLALEAAPNTGGVITLSSGSFAGATIKKSISIYGVGWEADAETNVQPTIINGNIAFTKSEEVPVVRDANIEGLYILGHLAIQYVEGLNITKCYVSQLRAEDYISNFISERITLTQCYVGDLHKDNSYQSMPNYILFRNCYIDASNGYWNWNGTTVFDHCIITNRLRAVLAKFTNNIILGNSLIKANSIAENNIFTAYSSLPVTVTATGNWFSILVTTIFEDAEDASYTSLRTFKLKTPELYTGTDSTEVGIRGGDFPWAKIPGTPRIISSKIDGKTSPEGKLSVSLKAVAMPAQ